MRRMLLVGAVLCAATSCTQVTQTTVVIDADEMVDLADPRVIVELFRADATSGELTILERLVRLPPESVDFPITMAVVPRGGDVGRRYDVRVSAIAGDRTWTTRAISGFVQGQRRELHMRLEDECRDFPCPDSNTTCRNGACVPTEIPRDMLTVPGASDAGTRVDAAVPSGTDAPLPLGTDAGPVEGCGWQTTEPIPTVRDVVDQPVLVSVDNGSVFIAYTIESELSGTWDIQMVRRMIGGTGWSAPPEFLFRGPANDLLREAAFSFRVDAGVWRIGTHSDEGIDRVRTQGGGSQMLDGVSRNSIPQMGWSAAGPRFFISRTSDLAIWTPSGPRSIVPGLPPGVPAYAPNDADDSVVANGRLYRHRNGVQLVAPVDLGSGLSCTLLSEPDGTLHVIYGASGADRMHRVVPPGATELSPPTTLLNAPRPTENVAAAGDGMFYWGGRIWDASGIRSVEDPIPSDVGTVETGGLVMDDAGGIHVVGRMGTSVRYAYRRPCPLP